MVHAILPETLRASVTNVPHKDIQLTEVQPLAQLHLGRIWAWRPPLICSALERGSLTTTYGAAFSLWPSLLFSLGKALSWVLSSLLINRPGNSPPIVSLATGPQAAAQSQPAFLSETQLLKGPASTRLRAVGSLAIIWSSGQCYLNFPRSPGLCVDLQRESGPKGWGYVGRC